MATRLNLETADSRFNSMQSKHHSLVQGDVFFVLAKPKSAKSIITYDAKNNLYVCCLKSLPTDGKANNELVKLFKKELGLKIEIVSGHTSKRKKIKVL